MPRRAGTPWASRPELAKLAAMPVVLIADYEAGLSTARSTDINAIKWVLERAGIEFIGESGVNLKGGKPG
jgi:hypothetical protein